jgi:hypothetical protein
MAGTTFGEQLYQEYVARGERCRFGYEDVQVLKAVQSAEELRQLCSQVSGEAVSESASAREMLEACVRREPEQNDAEAVGSVFTSGVEGCLCGIVVLPLMLLGLFAGVVLRSIGLRLDILAQRYTFAIMMFALLSLGFGIGLSLWFKIEWPLWMGTVSGVSCGISISQQSLRIVSVTLAAIIPIAVYCVSIMTPHNHVPVEAIASALGIGTGYGMSCPFEQIFAKRPGAKIKNGPIVLCKI